MVNKEGRRGMYLYRPDLDEAVQDRVLILRLYGAIWKKFRGNEYLWRLINIFNPDDLLQVFWLDHWRRKGRHFRQDNTLYVADFFQMCIQLLRKAKKRHHRAPEQLFADYVRTTNDMRETYLYRHSDRRFRECKLN